MKKQEASSILKEILAKCNLGEDSFILVEPNSNDLLSTGYKIRVKTILNKECRQKLREITRKHDLAVIEEQNQIIVYNPKTKQIKTA